MLILTNNVITTSIIGARIENLPQFMQAFYDPLFTGIKHFIVLAECMAGFNVR